MWFPVLNTSQSLESNLEHENACKCKPVFQQGNSISLFSRGARKYHASQQVIYCWPEGKWKRRSDHHCT
ncbi:uncharacterized protein PgNI_09369 [Pyricularia grisea]|uniref:Uncharacterized protein n=1 Tax=Pyricularia grisea TaxID=148305 RepID=A0A6P8ASP2_PYRGI|nr:uncharacterized protein PgNI_09369 [Pyricularia grisea]TLD05144.1 hypothetical protein PgNI_09369 [Pyricularia grisea]